MRIRLLLSDLPLVAVVMLAPQATAQEFKLRTGFDLKEPANYLAWRPDGKVLAVAAGDLVLLKDMVTAKDTAVLRGATHLVHSVAFHPLGKFVAAGDGDGNVRIWDALTGEQKHLISPKANEVLSKVAFSPNGKLLTVAGSGAVALGKNEGYGLLTLSDAATFKQRATLHAGRAVQSIAFSSDSTLLVTGDDDGRVRIWDVVKQKVRTVIRAYTGTVHTVALSPNGKTLALGGDDGRDTNPLKLWDLDAGKLLATLKGHGQSVKTVAFSPDGKLLASGGDDHQVRLWDPVTQKEIGTVKAEGGTLSVAFSPDGKLLAVAYGYKVEVWETPKSKPRN